MAVSLLFDHCYRLDISNYLHLGFTPDTFEPVVQLWVNGKRRLTIPITNKSMLMSVCGDLYNTVLEDYAKMVKPLPPEREFSGRYVEGNRTYCCKKKCFDHTKWTEVDGLACDKCWSYCLCLCNCVTWMTEGYLEAARDRELILM